MKIRGTPLSMLYWPTQSPSKQARRQKKYTPKGRQSAALSKLKGLAAACIIAGENGINRVDAARLAGYTPTNKLDNILRVGEERGFLFWEEEGLKQYDPGKIGILSWPADFARSPRGGDHV